MCGAQPLKNHRSSSAVWSAAHLQCGAGKKRATASSKHRSSPVACAKLLMPALQALCLRVALLRKVHVTEREEAVRGGTRDGVREVAQLRQCSLTAEAHAHGQVAAHGPSQPSTGPGPLVSGHFVGRDVKNCVCDSCWRWCWYRCRCCWLLLALMLTVAAAAGFSRDGVRGVDSAHMAKQPSSWRSSTGGSPDASHRQCCRCRRRWRGTKQWKWVRHVEEWSMKHAVSG